MTHKEKPIGYWIKEADKAITNKVNSGLKQFGITRFHWQVLNLIKENESITEEKILNILGNFINSKQLTTILDDFIQKSWITDAHQLGKSKLIQLTEKGKKAFDEIFSVQQKVRMQLFEGLTQEEYDTTINVLKTVVKNSDT